MTVTHPKYPCNGIACKEKAFEFQLEYLLSTRKQKDENDAKKSNLNRIAIFLFRSS